MNDGAQVRPTVDTQGLLQDMVVVSAGLGDFLDGLVEAAQASLERTHCVPLISVTLFRPRTRAMIASNSRTAWRLADLQCRFDEGPSFHAVSTGKTERVDDAASDVRFPLYLSAAVPWGVHSVLSVPVRLDGPERAAMTCYSPEPEAFPDHLVASAESFARKASNPLKLAVRLARLTDKADHLSAAMKSRTTIDLAAGIIMGQNRCTQDEAIEILRAASSARNMKLRELAVFVLNNTSGAPVTTHFD